MRILIIVLCILIAVSFLFSGEQGLQAQTAGSVIMSEDEKSAYSCIVIKRGDRITLTGEIIHPANKSAGTSAEKTSEIIFESEGGRQFNLQGSLSAELAGYTDPEQPVQITGTVTFEGRENILPVIELETYKLITRTH